MRTALLLAVLPLLASAAVGSRQKRFAAQSCMMTPDNTLEDVIEDANSVTLQCTFDDEIESCTWVHNEPMNENRNAQDMFDLKCTGSQGQSGDSCDSDTRVQFTFSSTSCGITISNTEPEDTGKWTLNGIGITSIGGVQSTKREFELFTYNASTLYMRDEDNNDVTSVESTYNYDNRNDEFIEGKSGYETVILKCGAQGGRPEPEFTWYIENDEINEDTDDADISVSNRPVGQEDPNGYIKNWESELEFRVDNRFMNLLNDAGVESNPNDGVVRFQLNCEVAQGSNAYIQREYVEVRIEREYDNGALAADTIGIIVGVIIALAIIVIVVVILLIAKSRKIWCFAESEYDDEKRNRQRRQHYDNDYRQDGGGHHRQRQHHQVHERGRRDDDDVVKMPSLPSSLHSKNRSSETSSSSNSNHSPPPRPEKAASLHYASLDRRAFMNDPRNQVLPPSAANTTEYASIVNSKQ